MQTIFLTARQKKIVGARTWDRERGSEDVGAHLHVSSHAHTHTQANLTQLQVHLPG